MPGKIFAGATTVTLSSNDFSSGYHAGYLAYLDGYQGRQFTEKHIHQVLCDTLLNVEQTDSYNTGYSVGFITALSLDHPIPVQLLPKGEA